MRADISASPARAVATNATRARRGCAAIACRLLPLRAPPRMKSDDIPGSSLEDRSRYAPGQVSWLSDRPTPRAFPTRAASVAFAGFVPDYSDGVAAASHRLPWIPEANSAATLAHS